MPSNPVFENVTVYDLPHKFTRPLVIEAKRADERLSDWVKHNLASIDAVLLERGAILFRGFQTTTPEVLEQAVSHITPELVNYVEGSSPRFKVTEKVYTSTEYPPEFAISLHNELSYAHQWPSKLYFLCLKPADGGGETPLADSREVFKLLSPALRERFLEKGVRYVRNLHGGRGVGLSWQAIFETSDREDVERYCQEGNIAYEWTRKGGLRTSQTRPSAIKHPRTGEKIWFNQVDQWHPSNLPEANRKSMLALLKEADLPINAYYGDGSALEIEALEEIRMVVDQVSIKIPWQEKDVLLLDNMLVAHGRCAYSGSRKVVLAMGGLVRLDEVETLHKEAEL
ncbi:MAG TPA: TauD/TfdA family dioxygenase [Ktedonobacteraceae bacterium]|nr:TauD/TfdA family dioxygenase [Ktedonobacteraceae bacterium]